MAVPLTKSLTPQTARKAKSRTGCIKNECLLRCTPWHRTSSTTFVVRLATISFLIATRLMVDLIRGSPIINKYFDNNELIV